MYYKKPVTGQLFVAPDESLIVYDGKCWHEAYWDIKKIDGEWRVRVIAMLDSGWVEEGVVTSFSAASFAEALDFLTVMQLGLSEGANGPT